MTNRVNAAAPPKGYTHDYRYISGNSHLAIDAQRWVSRVPKQYRDQAPRLVWLLDGSDAWPIEGQLLRQVSFDLYGSNPAPDCTKLTLPVLLPTE